MSTTVQLKIAELDKLGNEVHIHNFILRFLRDAGIPVQGALSIRGVEYGTLTTSSGAGWITYTWEDDDL